MVVGLGAYPTPVNWHYTPVPRKGFAIVQAYVDGHYQHVVRGNFGSALEYDVLVRRDIPPVGRYQLLDLPCYR